MQPFCIRHCTLFYDENIADSKKFYSHLVQLFVHVKFVLSGMDPDFWNRGYILEHGNCSFSLTNISKQSFIPYVLLWNIYEAR